MAEREFLGGVTNTTLHFEDGKMIIEEKVDAEPILHYADAARNHRFSADVCEGMMRHEGEIPWTVFQEECRVRGLPPTVFGSELGDAVIDAILADPKYARFRTSPHQRDPRIKIKGLR
jgi:hypothetical protein